MPRLFIGWKSGVGGVVKIMANNTDNPLTTPNTDWWKFRFNSETAAIGYSEYIESQNFPAAGYNWAVDTSYPYPATGTTKWRANTASFVGRNYLFMYVRPNAAWPTTDRAYFPYVMQAASSMYQPRYTFRRQNYPSSSDSFVLSSTACPASRICNYWNGSSWSFAAVDPWYSNAVQTGAAAEARLWITGYVGQPYENPPYTSGPYSDTAMFTGNPQTFAVYTVSLPVNNSAYPAVAPGTPVAGQKMVRIDRTTAKMSKPGYDVDTATDNQLIFNSNKLPMKIIKTGVVNIAAASTVTIPMDRALAATTFIDYQTSRVPNAAWIPPLPEDWSSEIWTMHKFSGNNLILWNRSPTEAVYVRYIVMAQDDLAPSTGTAKVFDANFATGNITLRRPGSAGTRFADTILDSDLTYLPIIANAYLPIGSAVASDDSKVGDRMWVINWTNAGNFTPYLMMRLHVRLRSDNTQQMYMPPFAKKLENASPYSASTFIASLENTRARVYCRTAGPEDAYRTGGGTWNTPAWDWEPIGLRYYIFAIPNSL